MNVQYYHINIPTEIGIYGKIYLYWTNKKKRLLLIRLIFILKLVVIANFSLGTCNTFWINSRNRYI